MPRYSYQCDECGLAFEAAHSMSEKIVDCGSCEAIASVRRVPAGFHMSFSDDTPECTRVGDVVRDHIEEAKEEIRKEKEEMTREYEP
jgi:putative FmdB family regulatory protein